LIPSLTVTHLLDVPIGCDVRQILHVVGLGVQRQRQSPAHNEGNFPWSAELTLRYFHGSSAGVTT